MSPRKSALFALIIGSLAALGSQLLGYGLVYPAKALGKSPLALAVFGGAAAAAGAIWLSARALQRSETQSERFVSQLGLLVACFFLFVIVFGFGIPDLLLSPKD